MCVMILDYLNKKTMYIACIRLQIKYCLVLSCDRRLIKLVNFFDISLHRIAD